MLKGFDHEEEVLKDFHFDVSGLVFTNLGPARYGPNAVAVLDLGPQTVNCVIRWKKSHHIKVSAKNTEYFHKIVLKL